MDQTVSKSGAWLSSNTLLICFSHLRWDFVYQRPQHLMTRAAHDYAVMYFEEPVFEHTSRHSYAAQTVTSRLTVMTPVLAAGTRT